jgi:uncharacterized protein YdeI (YjbR/CyaY-like superfamily)
MAPYKTVPGDEDQLVVPDRASWRAWLEKNHDNRQSIWLVFHKKNSPTTSIDYEAAVEEALCFGWIDSKVQRIDEARYRQYFSVRKPKSHWNGANKARVARLTEAGLMTAAGQAAIDVAKENGSWEFLDDIEALVLPDDLADALAQHKGARQNYEDFSNTKKQGVLMWVKQAKRAATRADRVAKVAVAAARGETPFDYL